MTAPLARNLVCIAGAIAASLTFMTAAAGPVRAASLATPVAHARLDATPTTLACRDARPRGDVRAARRAVRTIDDAFMLAPTRA